MFVDSTGPTHMQRRDAQTNRRIRQHVIRDFAQAWRKPSRNPQTELVVKEDRYASQGSDQPDKSDSALAQDQSSHCKNWEHPLVLAGPFWSQHPLAILDRDSGMDPFAPYGLALAAVGVDDITNEPGTFSGGFLFLQVFQVSELFRRIVTCPEVSASVPSWSKSSSRAIALARMTDVLGCIETAIGNPDKSKATSNNIIRAILGSICYSFVVSEFTQARLHLDGMKMIITMRGGVEKLSDDSQLRMMVFWVDIIAALLYDQKPRFPLPSDLLPSLSTSTPSNAVVMAIASNLKEIYPWRESCQYAIDSMDQIVTISTIIEAELARRGDALWTDEAFLGLRINPLAHRLLDLLPKGCFGSSTHAVFEALRVGMILWIIRMKQHSRSYPGPPTQYVEKLLILLMGEAFRLLMVAGPAFVSLYLWLAMICLSTASTTREREAASKLIADAMRQLDMKSWEDVIASVRLMPWISKF